MKKSVGLVIACSLFLVGCNTEGGEKPLWISEVNSQEVDQDKLSEEKKKLEGRFEWYKDGNLGSEAYYLANTQVDNKQFFANIELADYVGDLTEFEIVDKVSSEDEFGFLVKIKYPDLALSYYKKALKEKKALEMGKVVTYKELKEAFEEEQEWKETEVIWSNAYTEQRDGDLIYNADGNTFKALTGGIRTEKLVVGEVKGLEIYNKILNEELQKIKLGDIHRKYKEEEHYNLLKEESTKKLREYFVENTKIEMIESRIENNEMTKEKAIVQHPDYDKVINKLIREEKTTTEIIESLNKQIEAGEIENKEEILIGEIIENKDGVIFTGDFKDFFLNLGINGINRLK